MNLLGMSQRTSCSNMTFEKYILEGLELITNDKRLTIIYDILFSSSHTNIRVHFGIRENLSLFSPSRCTFFFQKTFRVLIHEFPKKTGDKFFFKRMLVLLVFLVFCFEKSYNLGKVVT